MLPATLGEEHRYSQNVYVHYLVDHGTQAEPLLIIDEASHTVAARRLHDMAFAGIVEDMDWSMALLCDRLGLPLLSLGSRQNVSANSLVPSPDYAVACRNWDSLGLRLYEDAANELEKQKQARLVRFELPAEASADSLGDRMRNALLGIDRGLAKISEAEISMADGVICEGFGPCAYYQPLDGYIRWAGPNTSSTIYLPLDANNDRIIRIGIAIVMSEAIRDGLALFINGSEIPLKRSFEMWKDGQYHLVCNAVIPKEKISAASQYTALEFRVPGVVATAPANVDFTGPAVSFALSDIRID